ncbi:hypothetical protein ANO11243_037240 [Dothideomycetidae sp. 11243]|nr:hypothetical protein ANO11243_037240 [fungal sp. No.11243]
MRSLLLLVLAPLAAADASTTASSTTATGPSTTATNYLAGPTPALAGAVHAAGEFGYTYIGCYNETTGYPGGNRALMDGSMLSNNSQTVDSCLLFCHGNGYEYCGIEYGRECWGGHYLSTLSALLPDFNCSYGCVGNLSEFCGGSLTLTTYNLTGSASGSSSSSKGGKTGAAVREVASAIGAVVLAGALGAAFSVF